MTIFHFHVKKSARKKYGIEGSLFSLHGDLIISDFRKARLLASAINNSRRAEGKQSDTVTAGQINALGLIHEIFHYLIRIYEEQENPGVFTGGLNYLKSNLGEAELDSILLEYVKDFPPLGVFNGTLSPLEYLNSSDNGKPNREIILEELILLFIENNNPATVKLEDLYSHKDLAAGTDYLKLVAHTEQFFGAQKPFGRDKLPLIEFLKKPILSSPYSIEEQLEFIRVNWKKYLPDKLIDRLLLGRDLILEDMKLFIQFGGGPKPTPPVPQYDFDSEYYKSILAKLGAGEKLTDDESRYYYAETEKFTRDIDWMPKVVMIAKNSFVWLHQLSKKYGRQITRLDQVPDEELDLLASWNFTALWLIGIWERSSASKKIKQITGNPEAAPSAYSIYDYIISSQLGGEEAFQNLKNRAWRRGIRLASDMVPNHTGIYSKWVVEKPDYFIQSDMPPYPAYTFYGPNLSDDPRVEVRIEDKYYSREDAAVVFQRRDSHTGGVKYIYHGNDGTHMPWNDTAQLNLLKPEVREALIQTIIHVARKFPIIRFDAAMTLAKKHFQRLWFPQPGTGGAIPSRSDYAMTRQAFDNAIPEEFWREVVDRINSELPETLLLAEAFWLMEGYFVRTLGMHRVYNSAFMHMTMKEENDKYRELIRNTLEFNPEILKRYVNFMSNPDEETAVNQYGKGDKYFGVAVLLVTLPGLPMFAHGQIEGYSEKYGMEYQKAYYEEYPDGYLTGRHEHEIFPLMKKRHLFSQVDNFEFYDFIDDFGNVNENVFAYSNRSSGESALVVYNNSYSQAKGKIHYSIRKAPVNGSPNMSPGGMKISDSIGIRPDFNQYCTFREHRTKLEYLLPCSEISESGFYFALNGYEYRIYYDFKVMHDDSGILNKLHSYLLGRGVESIGRAAEEMKLQPVHDKLKDLINPVSAEEFRRLIFPDKKKTGPFEKVQLPLNMKEIYRTLCAEIREYGYAEINPDSAVSSLELDSNSAASFFEFYLAQKTKKRKEKWLAGAAESLAVAGNPDQKENPDILLITFLLKGMTESPASGYEMFDRLMLTNSMVDALAYLGHKAQDIHPQIQLVRALLSKLYIIKDSLGGVAPAYLFTELIKDKPVCEYVMLNEFEGNLYFNKERFENLLDWIFTINIILLPESFKITIKKKSASKKTKTLKTAEIITANAFALPSITEYLNELKSSHSLITGLKTAAEKSGYKFNAVKDLLTAAVKVSKSASKKIAVKVTKKSSTGGKTRKRS